MVATAMQLGNALESDASLESESRSPEIDLSVLRVPFGALRGVTRHAADPLSRLERRGVYLPGV
jgi:hypothetical protein